ncbi:MAG TPA: hypothetical protein VKM55_01885 [Candidatus Lokiarchaeia archaeon]|nr:hypothetical protein [Candidatus Lokiarchaeia archaeon]
MVYTYMWANQAKFMAARVNPQTARDTFRRRTGVDLTNTELDEYMQRLKKAQNPFQGLGTIFGCFAAFAFIIIIVGSNNTDVFPAWEDLIPVLVIFFVVACVFCGIMNSRVTQLNNTFASEITARRQQEAEIQRQNQLAQAQQQQAQVQARTPVVQQRQAMSEATRMEKLKKLVKVSERLKISQMAQILAMDEATLYDRIVDWAADYGFTIDEDVVKFGAGRKEDFIAALDDAFQGWDKKTETKDGKLE